jgi:hypothetical protein
LIEALARHEHESSGYPKDNMVNALVLSSGGPAMRTAAEWRGWWAKQPK